MKLDILLSFIVIGGLRFFVAQRFLRCLGGWGGLWLHFGKVSDDAVVDEEQIHDVSSGKGSARWLTTYGFGSPM